MNIFYASRGKLFLWDINGCMCVFYVYNAGLLCSTNVPVTQPEKILFKLS